MPARANALGELEKRLYAARPGGLLSTVESLGGMASGKTCAGHLAPMMAGILLSSAAMLVEFHDTGRMSLEATDGMGGPRRRAVQGAHDKFPASLKDLCPDILKDVPKDVFTPNNELVCRANDNAYIVYSVGKNLKDDRGVSDGGVKDDIVAKVGDVDSATTLPTSRQAR